MTNKLKKVVITFVILIGIALGVGEGEQVKNVVVGGFSNIRGISNLQSTVQTDVTYTFGVVDIPIERAGAASSSTGFEFGRLLVTNTTAVTVASTSTGFAVTMNQSGIVKGCSFDLQTIPNTGTVSVMIQKNGTLQTGKYCKLPRSETFATNGGVDDVSTNETFKEDAITFVAGDRFGLISSSSNLNAATFDGVANLIVELAN